VLELQVQAVNMADLSQFDLSGEMKRQASQAQAVLGLIDSTYLSDKQKLSAIR
jgi:hypothetical protein